MRVGMFEISLNFKKKTAKICDVWVGRSLYVMSSESLIYSF